MATGTISAWNPYGVALDLKAVSGTVTRTSATAYTVALTVSWEVYYSGAKTNYGMSATSGGVTKVISSFGTKRSSGSAAFTGTYSISGYGAQTKSITVTFTNYEENWQGNVTKSSSKNITLSISVPAWTSYSITYNANGGSGAPSAQTKWKDVTLTLSTTKPSRTGHSFSKWNTNSSGTGTSYASGASYTANAAATLYAIWTANTYTVTFNANGGSGAPAAQTKTYGVALTLSSTKPTRTNYNFKGWGTSASATTVAYAAGGSYTANTAITLYAIWELAYVKPRINTLSVDRCDSAGTLTDEGTYAHVKFKWATDYTVTSITIKWKLSSDTSYSNSETVSTSGTSGTVSQVVGSGELDTDHTYDFYITVTDSGGSTYSTSTLPGMKFVIDLLTGGDGIGFGKPAELSGVADFGFQVRFVGGMLNLVLGNGTDLNAVTTPNIYAGLAATTAGYLNCPITTATSFTLEVMSAGASGQLMQRITSCTKATPVVYVRHYYSSAWGDWITM